MLKKHPILLFLTFILTLSYSQERFGINNSIYGGINTININPANIAYTPFRYDLNILTVHNYIDNNYLYLYPANIPKLMRYDGDVEVYNIYNLTHNKSSDIMLYDRYINGAKHLNHSLFVGLPSVMLQFNKFSVGFSTNLRSNGNLNRTNYKLAKVAFEGMTYPELQKQFIKIPEFKLNTTSWAEINLTFSGNIYNRNNKIIDAGITYKYLAGINNFYLNHRSSVIYYPNDDDMEFYNLNADYGHSIPDDNFLITGRGHSFDIGVTYRKIKIQGKKKAYMYRKGEGCPDFCNVKPFYLHKIRAGISLIDLGYIRFNRNAKQYEFNDAQSFWEGFARWSPKGIEGLDNNFSEHFSATRDTIARINDDKYTTLMPMALSLFYDYNLKDAIYLNATLVQSLPSFAKTMAQRTNVLAVTARYDRPYFGVAVPVVFYRYIYPRIGLAFRLGNILIIGTDRVGGFLNNKLSGMDFYISLKISRFNKCL